MSEEFFFFILVGGMVREMGYPVFISMTGPFILSRLVSVCVHFSLKGFLMNCKVFYLVVVEVLQVLSDKVFCLYYTFGVVERKLDFLKRICKSIVLKDIFCLCECGVEG